MCSPATRRTSACAALTTAAIGGLTQLYNGVSSLLNIGDLTHRLCEAAKPTFILPSGMSYIHGEPIPTDALLIDPSCSEHEAMNFNSEAQIKSSIQIGIGTVVLTSAVVTALLFRGKQGDSKKDEHHSPV